MCVLVSLCPPHEMSNMASLMHTLLAEVGMRHAQLAPLHLSLLSHLIKVRHQPSVAASATSDNDRLLSVREAAEILKVTPQWLYRHARHLPFSRRLSRKALRFSEAGLRRWAASRRSLNSPLVDVHPG